MPTPSGAANAYNTIARLTDAASGLGKTAGTGGGAGGSEFGAVLKEAMNSVIESGKKSDTQSQALAAGKANMVDVVTAVAESEVAVDAVVAVRDRVIEAYQEIMRMPI
jgi:flagellar hook-basal body complex protein FliE